MKIRLLVPVTLFALCCAWSTPAAAEEAAGQSAEAADSDSEVVCRVIKVTGSRLGAKRTCMTRAAWRQQRQVSREEAERAQRTGYSNYTPPPTDILR